MLKRHEHQGIVWIDLESPTHDEIRSLIDEFQIETLVAEELLLPTQKPRIETYENFVYVVLHFPALRHTHKTNDQEIDFIVGRNFIITTRYEMIDPLHKFSKVFEVNSTLDKSNIGEHAGFVFYYMLKKLYKSVEHEVEYVRDVLEDVEQELFEGHEKRLVVTLSEIGRDLLNLRQSIEPHRDVLKNLETDGQHSFGKDFAPYLRSLTNEYYRVHNRIMRHVEALRELRETNNSLLTTKQNEVMKVLTILAFVTFPLSLIAGIFGMNTIYNPIVGSSFDFWKVLALMGGATVAMFFYFKTKRWL